MKQDLKEVSKQSHELKYICGVWYDLSGKHLHISVLRDVIKKVGKSRRRIYAVLTYLNYRFDPRKKK